MGPDGCGGVADGDGTPRHAAHLSARDEPASPPPEAARPRAAHLDRSALAAPRDRLTPANALPHAAYLAFFALLLWAYAAAASDATLSRLLAGCLLVVTCGHAATDPAVPGRLWPLVAPAGVALGDVLAVSALLRVAGVL